VRSDVEAAEALRTILAEAPVLPAETVAVREAEGRILAEAVVSSRRLPPEDNSAMDGYAVRRADLAGASEARPVALRVAFEVAAGAVADRALAANEAARIFTGAPIPPGADAVVRQEDVAREAEQVLLRACPAPRENVRDAGEDVQRGEVVLEPGARIGPAQVGMLASLGRGVVAVHQRPRVALLSGGDELVEPDGDVAGGRIVSSNSWSLAALCREVGAVPVYLGIARDTPDDLEQRFRAGLGADVLVSSAGVSVGDRDHVRGVLEKLGCKLLFWGVRIKPGFPLAFGRMHGGTGALVFGLPGNPVSAMVTFEEFVRPALRRMAGHTRLFRPVVRARLGERLAKAPGRLHFVRVRLEREGAEIVARSTGTQSSGALRSMVRAQGLVVFPAEARELRAGELVTVQVLDEDFLGSTEPGF
jgi:molybdopterin molybdotransferase